MPLLLFFLFSGYPLLFLVVFIRTIIWNFTTVDWIFSSSQDTIILCHLSWSQARNHLDSYVSEKKVTNCIKEGCG